MGETWGLGGMELSSLGSRYTGKSGIAIIANSHKPVTIATGLVMGDSARLRSECFTQVTSECPAQPYETGTKRIDPIPGKIKTDEKKKEKGKIGFPISAVLLPGSPGLPVHLCLVCG